MGTMYDKELISYIDYKGFCNDIIIYESTDGVINELEEYFVMGYGGIDWNQTKIIFMESLDSNVEQYLVQAKNFLKKIIISFSHLQNETVFVIGDNLTELSYKMKFQKFIELFDQFLKIPQHTYIWFTESKKCINFSFENEVFFG